MTGELQPYIALARRHSVLSAELEAQLAKRAKRGDRQAADQLVMAHLRLVIGIARGYRGYKLPSDDLVSEGCVGLLHALRKYDPARARFATYAAPWVHAAMRDYAMRTASMVKLGTTAAQKTLFWRLRRAKAQVGATGALTDRQAQEIARRLGVREDEVQAVNARLGGDASLDAPVSHMRDDDAGTTWIEVLSDPARDPEQQVAEQQEKAQRSAALRAALKALSARERRILTARRLTDEPATLEALAGQYGVSRERIRQIEMQALKRVRHGMVPEGRQSLDSETGRT